MKKVVFQTLGCKVNQYETEAMAELFEKEGFEFSYIEEEADVYVINTCTVTNMSASKSRQFIRRCRRLNEEAIIAVVGCYSQVSPEEIEEIEGVDIILGTTNRHKIVDLVKESLSYNKTINKVADIRSFKEFEDINVQNMESMTRAYIKIQDGCNRFCSYCIIPYARGPIRSRDMDDIEREVRNLASLGYKEIVLTGIHVASYGKDLKDIDLIDLVKTISKIEGIERIRFSSVEPSIITREFLQAMVDSKKVCDHFHLSLQSGSDSVLQRMNRKYDTKFYRERVDLIREYMPDAGITTDIIVGFPSESKEEFNETLKFVEEIGFSRIHVFKYSPRKGTPAAKMDGQINGLIKNERSQELIKLGDRLSLDFSRKFLEKKLSILYEERNENYNEGYSTNYIRVRTYGQEDLEGKILETSFKEIEGENLLGEV